MIIRRAVLHHKAIAGASSDESTRGICRRCYFTTLSAKHKKGVSAGGQEPALPLPV
jgi:hypothetical protein